MVRPTLEYACPARSTSLTLGLQSDMERVQIHAMNIIYPNIPYIEALANAQLTSLKQTRAQLCEHFLHTNRTAAAQTASATTKTKDHNT